MSKFFIQTLNNISSKGLTRFSLDHYEISSSIDHPDAILVRSEKMHEMTFSEKLKAVGRAGAGVNNIPIEKLSKLGIPVFNTPGANANAVKELVFTSMLMIQRKIKPALEFVDHLTGSESEIHKQIESGKKHFSGHELAGKTLGVIGLGAIGIKVANAAITLGMDVIGFDPGITIQGAWSLDSHVSQAYGLDDLLSQCDFVSIHVPFVETTKNLINAEKIGLLPKDAVLLNFSRNGIIDDQAAITALNDGHLRAYATDFPSPELLIHPKVLCFPHLGASTAEAEENCAVMIVDQIKDYLENGNIVNSVNFPQVVASRSLNTFRLTVTNSNIPNMVGQFSSILAKHEFNIIDMINKSKNDLAYTIIDLDRPVNQNIIDQISSIQGVLKVRHTF